MPSPDRGRSPLGFKSILCPATQSVETREVQNAAPGLFPDLVPVAVIRLIVVYLLKALCGMAIECPSPTGFSTSRSQSLALGAAVCADGFNIPAMLSRDPRRRGQLS